MTWWRTRRDLIIAILGFVASLGCLVGAIVAVALGRWDIGTFMIALGIWIEMQSK